MNIGTEAMPVPSQLLSTSNPLASPPSPDMIIAIWERAGPAMIGIGAA